MSKIPWRIVLVASLVIVCLLLAIYYFLTQKANTSRDIAYSVSSANSSIVLIKGDEKNFKKFLDESNLKNTNVIRPGDKDFRYYFIRGFDKIEFRLVDLPQPYYPIYYTDNNNILAQSIGYSYDRNTKKLTINLYLDPIITDKRTNPADKKILEMTINRGFIRALLLAGYEANTAKLKDERTPFETYLGQTQKKVDTIEEKDFIVRMK